MASPCQQTLAWLQAQQPDLATPPPDELCEHIAQCAKCRGELLLLLAGLFGVPQDIQDISCDDCQERLAAYVDEELDHGIQSAARDFPEVWWHLWVCAECAETHRIMVGILDPQPAPLMVVDDKQSITQLIPSLPWRFDMPRVFLNRLIQARLELGVAWGEDEDQIIALEEEWNEYKILLHMQRQIDGNWSILVKIVPPILGQAIFSLGTETFRAAFGSDGQALANDIPSTLLSAIDGPGMNLLIEPIDV